MYETDRIVCQEYIGIQKKIIRIRLLIAQLKRRLSPEIGIGFCLSVTVNYKRKRNVEYFVIIREHL